MVFYTLVLQFYLKIEQKKKKEQYDKKEQRDKTSF